MKAIRKLTVIFLMIGMVTGFGTTCAYAAPAPVECTWHDLHMDATGLLSWKMDLPAEYADLAVQKYTISVDIMTTGVWRENYKTFVSTENVKEIYYGLVGIYRFRVKASFVGGLVSDYSGYSNQCTVTSDYINQGDNGGSSGGPGTTPGSTPGSTPTGPGYPGSGIPDWVEKDGQWFTNNGGWYYVNNGQMYTGRWACIYNPYANTARGQRSYDWFCFDGNGRMLTGWYTDGAGNTFYLNPNSDGSAGKMVTGWQNIDGYTYYFDEREGTGYMGAMVRNATVGGHVLDASGRMIR